MSAQRGESGDPLEPSAALLVKIGSALIHAEEYLSPDPHPLDLAAFEALMSEPEVTEWLGSMNALALLPVKR
jgi:hypothetical protein